MTIDYARMKKVHPKQKAALTRAIHSGVPLKVLQVCDAAITEWDAIGAWPDDWRRWHVALADVMGWRVADSVFAV